MRQVRDRRTEKGSTALLPFPDIHNAPYTTYCGYVGWANEALTGCAESPFIGHALASEGAAGPERAGVFLLISCVFQLDEPASFESNRVWTPGEFFVRDAWNFGGV